jgi:hypothetical protein
MKTRSRDQDRTAGVGWVKRPSRGFGAMGETRRFRTFAQWLAPVKIDSQRTCEMT